MKTLVLIFFCMASAAVVNAQAPVPEPDTLKTPVRQNDPTPQTTAPNVDYTQNKIKITAAELPDAIQKSLQAGPQYTGWETADVFKDKAGKVFIIEVHQGDSKRVFRFDKTGRPVLED
jgi:biopolymer transport protein ExbD